MSPDDRSLHQVAKKQQDKQDRYRTTHPIAVLTRHFNRQKLAQKMGRHSVLSMCVYVLSCVLCSIGFILCCVS
jgi:hypothetical protein